MCKWILIGCAVFSSMPSFAGKTISNAEVTNVRVRQNVAYVKFDQCARYSLIYLQDEYDKVMYSTALAAGAAKLKVRVEFAGDDCSSSEQRLVYLDVGF